MIAVDEIIAALPEWEYYVQNPSQSTFSKLVKECRGKSIFIQLLRSLYAKSSGGGNWKFYQHLSLLLEDSGNLTYAWYFADKAIKASSGNVLARLILIKILWRKRLPLAVLYQTQIASAQIRRIKDKRIKRFLQREIAGLNVMAYAYLGDTDSLRPWLNYLKTSNTVDSDVVLQLLLGASHKRDNELQIFAARTLAPCWQHFGGRVQGAIKSGLRLSMGYAMQNLKDKRDV